MKCPHCGQEHPDNTKFCPETGKKLEQQFLFCDNPDCDFRQPLPPTANFCPNCGQQLSGDNNMGSQFSSHCLYDSISEFRNGLAEVSREGKCGFINNNGDEIIPCCYDGFKYWFENENCIFYKKNVEYEDFYGVININNNIIIPAIYDDIIYEEAIDAFSVYTKKGKTGIISKDGKAIIPVIWDFISSFMNGYALAIKSSSMYLIDVRGSICYTFRDCYRYPNFLTEELIVCRKEGLYGIINKQGKIKVPFEYESIRKISFNSYSEKEEPHIIIRKNGFEGLLSDNGNTLINCEYKRIFPHLNKAIVKMSDGEWRIYDFKNHKFIGLPFEDFHDFTDEYITAYYDGLCSVIDWNGNFVINPDKFQIMLAPQNNLVAVKYHDEDTASYYEDDEDFNPDDFDSWGLINLNGETVIPWIYDAITYPDNDLIVATFQGRNIIINMDNKLVFANGIDEAEWQSVNSDFIDD